MRARPKVIIIGAMKSATSTLHEQLAAQPGIFMSTPKEPNFFSDPEVWARGMSWYASLFEHAPAGSITGESSTHYTKLPTYPKVVDRLAEHVPDARLIYVMRHPIDRAVSHYIHGWTERTISGSLSDALARNSELVNYGRYAFQLRPFIERFGKRRILPVFFDHLRAHPQEALERVCRFIGYSGVPQWQPERAAQNASNERLRRSRLRDLLVHAPGLSMIRRKLVPQVVRDRIKRLWMMRGRPRLGTVERRGLAQRFDPDLAELGTWLGVELRCETFVARTKDAPLEWT